MKKQTSKLLGITQAAQLLGVHPLTLRSWAEKGYLPHYRTPGGHRRFRRDELLTFIAKMNQAAPEEGLLTAARQAVRQAIATLPETDLALSQQRRRLDIADDQRQWMRDMGKKMLKLTIRYASGARGSQILEQAEKIGRAYAAFAAQHQMSISETVATFNFFRDRIIESTFEVKEQTSEIDISNPDLYRRLNRFFNQVLLATVKAAEEIVANR